MKRAILRQPDPTEESPLRYSPAEREDLARRREQWILRTEQGEDPKRVRRELKLKVKIGTLMGLRPRYQKGGRTWQALLERRHGIAVDHSRMPLTPVFQ